MGLVALQDPVDLEVPSVTAGIKTQLGDLSKLHKAFLDFQYAMSWASDSIKPNSH